MTEAHPDSKPVVTEEPHINVRSTNPDLSDEARKALA